MLFGTAGFCGRSGSVRGKYNDRMFANPVEICFVEVVRSRVSGGREDEGAVGVTGVDKLFLDGRR